MSNTLEAMFQFISLSWKFILQREKSLKRSANDVYLNLIQCFTNLLVDGNFCSWNIYNHYVEHTGERLGTKLLWVVVLALPLTSV
jgi:hypothetical protein